MTIGLRQCNPKPHMQTSAGRVVLRALVVLSLGILIESSYPRAQRPASIPEEIEWTWEVRPQHAHPKLPNVLLLGDSITRNYFPQVTQDLRGVANVYLMASSTSVGDPRLSQQIAEFAATQRVSFPVIHFNNAMHDWRSTEAQIHASTHLLLLPILQPPAPR